MIRGRQKSRKLTWGAIVILAGLFTLTAATISFAQQYALQFDGVNDYVTFGQATSTLGVQNFTLEAWVKRSEGGKLMTTGTNGLDGVSGRPKAYPVLTKGRGEGETPANINTNFFLGITETGYIGADFEDTVNGGNHPVWGTTQVAIGEWHHIAATYEGQTWNLYLDGNLDKTLTLSSPFTPEFNSTQHAALATGLGSNGLPDASAPGHFAGVIDEARIWNYARTQQDIRDNRFQELSAGTGLLGRWGLNENSGTNAFNSIGGSPAGTLTNGPTWVAGFPIPDNDPPAAPTGLTAVSGDTRVQLKWAANAEPDIAGYNVYRSLNSGGPWGSPINGTTLINGPAYADLGLVNGTSYYYVVTAVDTSDNESTASMEAISTPTVIVIYGSALQFNGTDQYVTFGEALGLGTPNFTLECWFMRTGTGTPTTTGTSGIPDAIPLVTKGRAESDASSVDMNYLLGIRSSDNVLAADFEEGAGQTQPGLNHPVFGVTHIQNNVWYHAAATYDGTTWRLYLDGILENELVLGVNRLPRSDSIQHAGIATAMTSTGAAAGYFNGVIDEVRIWNTALPETEIQDNMYAEIPCYTDGLIGHWKMNEGSGATIANSAGGAIPGTLTNGPIWTAGKTFAKGDLDCDCDVDGSDIVAFASALAASDLAADFNNDGVVDAADLEIFAGKFGKSDCPSLAQ
jgi:hypothetical protein